MISKKYYEILGISQNATDDEIKKAYKMKAKIYHPDRNINSTPEQKKEYEEKFKELANAYDILINKKEEDEEETDIFADIILSPMIMKWHTLNLFDFYNIAIIFEELLVPSFPPKITKLKINSKIKGTIIENNKVKELHLKLKYSLQSFIKNRSKKIKINCRKNNKIDLEIKLNGANLSKSQLEKSSGAIDKICCHNIAEYDNIIILTYIN